MNEEQECFSCCQPVGDDDRVCELSIDLKDKSRVKVETALSSIFNLQLLSQFRGTHFDCDVEEDDLLNVTLCVRCSDVLLSLYKLFMDFQQLCHKESQLTRRIEKLKSLTKQLALKANSESSFHQTLPKSPLMNEGPWVKLIRLTPQEIAQNVNSDNRECYRVEENENIEMDSVEDSLYDEVDQDQWGVPKDDSSASNKFFNCDKCSKEFVHAQNLETHQRICHVKKTSRNKSSSKSVTKKVRVKRTSKKSTRHSSSANLPPTFSCSICNQSFVKSEEVTDHILTTHVQEGEKSCPLCSLEVDPCELKKHLKNHAKEMRQCLTCGKRFLTNYKMLRHLQSHLEKDNVHSTFKCDKCDKQFYFISLLRDHKRTAHRREEVEDTENVSSPQEQNSRSKCTICKKLVLISSDSTLAQHMETCRGSKCHACPVCQRMCTKKYLRIHLKTHGPRQGQFSCSVCSKVLSSSGSLKTHLAVHSGERKFPCTICGVSFAQSGNLRGHLRVVHFKERSFLCTLCGASFGKSYGLKRHMLGHGDERSFKCGFDGCDKRFKETEALRKHERIHCGDIRQSLCTFCGKTFSQGSLRRHILTHTGERTKTCPYSECSMSFIDNRQLKRHVRNRHNELDMSCGAFKRDDEIFLGFS